MKINTKPLRGMRDLLEPYSAQLVWLAERFRHIARLYGYEEVMPPTLERFELFAVKSGEEIRRTMYVFRDKAGREVALRPEVTASIARIYLDKLRGRSKPLRLMYVANCFRYDEPQSMRYREFYQAGVELIGSAEPAGDAEVVMMLDEFYSEVGLEEYVIKVDNIGIHRALMSKAGVMPEEQDTILHLLDKGLKDEAMARARRSAASRGPVEVLEQLITIRPGTPGGLSEARELLKGFPEALSELERLETVLSILRGSVGGRIIVDTGFARGLAYYTGIIFEVTVPGLPVSIAGGGRYDGLIGIYGGEEVPATGFAVGLDRTLEALRLRGKAPVISIPRRTLVIPLVGEAVAAGWRLVRKLHSLGVPATLYHGRTRKLGKALSYASGEGYEYVVIIGRREVEEGLYTVKDLRRGEQVSVGPEDVLRVVSGVDA